MKVSRAGAHSQTFLRISTSQKEVPKKKNKFYVSIAQDPTHFLQSLIADLANPKDFLNQLVLVVLS